MNSGDGQGLKCNKAPINTFTGDFVLVTVNVKCFHLMKINSRAGLRAHRLERALVPLYLGGGINMMIFSFGNTVQPLLTESPVRRGNVLPDDIPFFYSIIVHYREPRYC